MKPPGAAPRAPDIGPLRAQHAPHQHQPGPRGTARTRPAQINRAADAPALCTHLLRGVRHEPVRRVLPSVSRQALRRAPVQLDDCAGASVSAAITRTGPRAGSEISRCGPSWNAPTPRHAAPTLSSHPLQVPRLDGPDELQRQVHLPGRGRRTLRPAPPPAGLLQRRDDLPHG